MRERSESIKFRSNVAPAHPTAAELRSITIVINLSLIPRNKDKVLKGVRNATWDMTAVYTWSYLAMKEKAKGVVWLLCTEDNALRAVASSLIVTGDELEHKKKAMFCKYMGEAKGKQIYDKLIDMYKRKDSDSSRRANTFDNNSDLYQVVDELEQELLTELTKHK